MTPFWMANCMFIRPMTDSRLGKAFARLSRSSGLDPGRQTIRGGQRTTRVARGTPVSTCS